MLAAQWVERLETPEPALRRMLAEVYGHDAGLQAERLNLLSRVLRRFLQRFGNRPVRVFRSPGRINLRGMHVDTHGGYLNLMTHQRETIAAVTPADIASCEFDNIAPQFGDVTLDPRPLLNHPAFSGDWMPFIMHPDIRGGVESARGQWSNYLMGALLRSARWTPPGAFRGMSGVIGSDLPRGAALSSSAALCVALCCASAALNGVALEQGELIPAARDAEWYTGSRCGLSDQTAMVLGGRNEVVTLAIQPGRLDVTQARRMTFPDDARILVINSYTERSLSGAATVEYTRNRFAYSLALEILRQEALQMGIAESATGAMASLATLTPEDLEPLGGHDFLCRLLLGIPEVISIAELRSRYHLPNLDQAYLQYFGTVPEALRPTHIQMRGPLLFGIAESARARVFPDLLRQGALREAGELMSIGHDGDRRLAAGQPWAADTSDGAINQCIAQGHPILKCPGAYGASTPVLDLLVDTALAAGALGASLTGAGMAGTVLALCRKEDAAAVAEAIDNQMAGAQYAALTAKPPLSDEELAHAVVINQATAPAGELVMPE